MAPDPAEAALAALAARLRERLLPLARARQTITYRELAAQTEVPPPQAIHKLTLALEALAREDHAAGRPLIAALAVSRTTGATPGRGFFQLLAALGRYDGSDQGPEAAAVHAAELERAWNFWSRFRQD